MHVELPEKLYYSIGEVADAFGVNASLIRFWEKEFDVIKPKKNAKGNRDVAPLPPAPRPTRRIAHIRCNFSLNCGRGGRHPGRRARTSPPP